MGIGPGPVCYFDTLDMSDIIDVDTQFSNSDSTYAPDIYGSGENIVGRARIGPSRYREC